MGGGTIPFCDNGAFVGVLYVLSGLIEVKSHQIYLGLVFSFLSLIRLDLYTTVHTYIHQSYNPTLLTTSKKNPLNSHLSLPNRKAGGNLKAWVWEGMRGVVGWRRKRRRRGE